MEGHFRPIIFRKKIRMLRYCMPTQILFRLHADLLSWQTPAYKSIFVFLYRLQLTFVANCNAAPITSLVTPISTIFDAFDIFFLIFACSSSFHNDRCDLRFHLPFSSTSLCPLLLVLQFSYPLFSHSRIQSKSNLFFFFLFLSFH